MSDEVQKALFKMESWCAYQDRSIHESIQKLKNFHLTDIDCQKIVARLVEQQFLDDHRFAESFVSGKFRMKGWGKQKIKMYLREHRLSDHLIHGALSQIDPEEYRATCCKLCEKKSHELQSEKDSYVKKSKIIRFLQSRGFEMEIIMDCYAEVVSKGE